MRCASACRTRAGDREPLARTLRRAGVQRRHRARGGVDARAARRRGLFRHRDARRARAARIGGDRRDGRPGGDPTVARRRTRIRRARPRARRRGPRACRVRRGRATVRRRRARRISAASSASRSAVFFASPRSRRAPWMRGRISGPRRGRVRTRHRRPAPGIMRCGSIRSTPSRASGLTVLQPLGLRSTAYVAPLSIDAVASLVLASWLAAWLVLALPGSVRPRAARPVAGGAIAVSLVGLARRCSRSSPASRRETSPCSCTAARCSRRPRRSRARSPLPRRAKPDGSARAKGGGSTSRVDAGSRRLGAGKRPHADRPGAAGAIDRVGAASGNLRHGAHRSAPIRRGRPDRRRRGGRAARVGGEGAGRERARRGRHGDRRRGRGGRTHAASASATTASAWSATTRCSRSSATRRRRSDRAADLVGVAQLRLPRRGAAGDLLRQPASSIETAPSDGAGTAIHAAGGVVREVARRRASPRHHHRRRRSSSTTRRRARNSCAARAPSGAAWSRP